MKRDWIVCNANHGGRFECLRCGESYEPRYPVPIDIVVAISIAFDKMHRDCEERPEGLHCGYCGKTGHDPRACSKLEADTPEQWWSRPGTGASSRTIWCVMMRTGFAPLLDIGPRIPLDPSDFGRCHRLLRLFPAWRARLDEMRTVPGWAPFLDAWPELEALYEEESKGDRAPKLFARMQELSNVVGPEPAHDPVPEDTP